MPTSHRHRRNGSVHIAKGPIPYKYVPKQEELSDGSPAELAPDVLELNPGLNLELPGLGELIPEQAASTQKNWPQGPRDMHNHGRHHKFMIIPEFAKHIFFRPKKGPDGRMGLQPDVREIPLYTLAPRGKNYSEALPKGRQSRNVAKQHFEPIIPRSVRRPEHIEEAVGA